MDDNRYLAQIADDVKSIKFWVKFWSIVGIIGIVGGVIVYFTCFY